MTYSLPHIRLVATVTHSLNASDEPSYRRLALQRLPVAPLKAENDISYPPLDAAVPAPRRDLMRRMRDHDRLMSEIYIPKS